MQTIGSYEAKTHLPKLLERVERGEEITITRRGVPIARLVPASKPSKLDIQNAVATIREIRKHVSLRGLSLKKMRHEGHQY